MKAEAWVNLDKYASFSPDVVHDLEDIPWPFDDNSCNKISVIHMLKQFSQDSCLLQLCRSCTGSQNRTPKFRSTYRIRATTILSMSQYQN